jgi:hypothetical protein
MVNGNNSEGVTTPAPISDADSRARLVEERKNRLPCTLVCDDGLHAGKVFGVNCVGPWACIEAGGCFWRRWHQLPADKHRKNCDVGLDD